MATAHGTRERGGFDGHGAENITRPWVISSRCAHPVARARHRAAAVRSLERARRGAARERTSRHLARAGTALLSAARVRASRRRSGAARTGCALYSTDPGRPSLRRVLAERLGQHVGIECGFEDLVITAGANHGFATALTTLVSPGEEVVLPAPYFTNHHMQVRASGAVAVEAPLADQKTYCLTWDDLAPAVTPRTRAVVLCNPSNPTGAPVDAAHGDTHRAGARRPRHLRHQRRDLHAVRLRRRSLERRVRPRLAPQRRRHRDVLEVVCDDGMAGRLRAGRSRDLRAGHQDSGRDDHLRADDLADRRRGRGPRRVGVSAAVPPRVHAAASARRGEARRDPHAAVDAHRRRVLRVRSRRRLHRFDGARQRLLEEAHVVTIPGAAFGQSGEGCLRLSFGSVSGEDLVEGLDRLEDYFSRGG